MSKYNIKITISNENSEEDNTELKYEYEYESKKVKEVDESEEVDDDLFDLLNELKEKICSKEHVSGDNTYNIDIEVETDDYYAYKPLSIISDSIDDVHTLIDSVIH